MSIVQSNISRCFYYMTFFVSAKYIFILLLHEFITFIQHSM